MPSPKKAKLSAPMTQAVNGGEIMETSYVEVHPPITFPQTLGDDGLTLTLTIPENPRLLIDTQATMFTATLRVLQIGGVPFEDRAFSTCNAPLWTMIKRIGLQVNGREIAHQDNFGFNNAAGMYEDGWPGNATRAFGQGSRRAMFQASDAIKLIGPIDWEPFRCLSHWPSDCGVTLTMNLHSSNYMLWEAEEELQLPRLVLRLEDASLICAMNLYQPTPKRSLALGNRMESQILYQYIADTESRATSSPIWTLPAYPIWALVFCTKLDVDGRQVNPLNMADFFETLSVEVTVAARKFKVIIDEEKTRYAMVAARNLAFVYDGGVAKDRNFAFEPFWTKERISMGYLAAVLDMRQHETGRPSKLPEKPDLYAEKTPARVQVQTKHRRKIDEKFVVNILFTLSSHLTLDRSNDSVTIVHS